ncbi:uncharacterized protein LOC100183103 [Ciona intestinalis]
MFECEETNLPEKLSSSTLQLWQKSRKKVEDDNTTKLITSCPRYFRYQQHINGLSFEMKKHRKCRPRETDLSHKIDASLPLFLQDIGRYNPELMRNTTTRVRCSLPTKEVIEHEKFVESAGCRKLWSRGLVLQEQESLVDPQWNKHEEVKHVNAIREEVARSPSVMAGILQQWQR